MLDLPNQVKVESLRTVGRRRLPLGGGGGGGGNNDDPQIPVGKGTWHIGVTIEIYLGLTEHTQKPEIRATTVAFSPVLPAGTNSAGQ